MNCLLLGIIQVHELHNVLNAFATLIELLYCLNMDYPKCLRYTFEVVQKMFLKNNYLLCLCFTRSS
uniref:Uncharacterized protein n=1 Tax=Oncorhynchus kisutch TaxID=8019 RepID=A0A8C7IZY9_ONCKI